MGDLIKSLLSTINDIIAQYPIVVTFLCAELFFLLTRHSEITAIFKKSTQRTTEENLQIEKGMKRSLVLEAILFVPASIILFRFAIFPLISNILLQKNADVNLWYALMGIVGYGFPFLSIRRIMTMIALKTLKEFAEISHDGNEQSIIAKP